MSKKILIIEDDKNILKLLRYNLEKESYKVFTTITAEDGLDLIDEYDIDLIILDLMLPKMSGLDFCRKVKHDEFNSKIPIIMVTAKGEEVDRIVGFELGVDDYIVKPFSVRELVLRVKAVLRRKPKEKTYCERVEIGEIILDPNKYKVLVSGKEIKLTNMEFKLLQVLMLQSEKVFSRDELLSIVWDLDSAVTTRTIDTHVKCLRKKLKKQGSRIQTVRGIGYKFCV